MTKGKRKLTSHSNASKANLDERQSSRHNHGEESNRRKRRKPHRKEKRKGKEEEIPIGPYVDRELAVRHKAGYICLMGHWVERVALEAVPYVPEHALMKRKMRDGDPFHITIAKAMETTPQMRRSESLQEMYNIVRRNIPPVNLGLGMVRHGENGSRSWYCSISWAAGQQIRKMCNLPPKDFHLTLGFDHRDIHVHKGPSTLLIHHSIATTPILTKEQIKGLREAAIIEAHTSKERSLISFGLALTQAELVADDALVLSIKLAMESLKTPGGLSSIQPLEK